MLVIIKKLTNTSGLRKEHENPRELNYEALYTSWATDLLPEEFDENDIYFERDEDIIYYLGSVGGSNERDLFHFAMKNRNNKELILEQMKIVKEKHTYLNRVNDIITVVNKKY